MYIITTTGVRIRGAEEKRIGTSQFDDQLNYYSVTVVWLVNIVGDDFYTSFEEPDTAVVPLFRT